MRDVTNPSRITTQTWLPTDQAGNALHDPLSAYKIADQDVAADPQYYGFTAADGAWYILCQLVASNAFRYAAGGSGYRQAWLNRGSLGYDYFDKTF